MAHFTTIFALKLMTLFFNLLYRNAIDIQTPSVVRTDLSVVQRARPLSRVYACLGIKWVKRAKISELLGDYGGVGAMCCPKEYGFTCFGQK